MRWILAMLMAAWLCAPALAQTSEELALAVRELKLDDAQLEQAERLLDREARREHDEVYRELSRVLTPEQLERLTSMTRWGRYGPGDDLEPSAAEKQLILALVQEICHSRKAPQGELGERLRALLRGEVPVPGLWPTARQSQALTTLIEELARQGAPADRARIERELRTILTPEQIEFLKRLEELESSE
ncbi:MAG: hypothetical protein AB1758_27680 [Candidatus Eremiobacterota bacterium]